MRNILRRDKEARRRCLNACPTVSIPVAERMRLVATETSHTSLDTAFRHVYGEDVDVAKHFHETVQTKFGELGDVSPEKKDDAIKETRLAVFKDVCSQMVRPDVLSLYMTDAAPSAQHMFQFRKSFASQLAVNSLLQHAFAIVERSPSKFVFCLRSGQVLSPDFRTQYNQGLFHEPGVPFRLTRSVEEALGLSLHGTFTPALATASSAVAVKEEVLRPLLEILLRDDVMAWWVSNTFLSWGESRVHIVLTSLYLLAGTRPSLRALLTRSCRRSRNNWPSGSIETSSTRRNDSLIAV